MKNIEEMSLEEAMKALESTVSKLEKSELSLEKSMEIFEQGVKLVARSRALLDDYNKRITYLKKENGMLKEVPMELENE